MDEEGAAGEAPAAAHRPQGGEAVEEGAAVVLATAPRDAQGAGAAVALATFCTGAGAPPLRPLVVVLDLNKP